MKPTKTYVGRVQFPLRRLTMLAFFSLLLTGCCVNDAKPSAAWTGAWVPDKWSDELIGSVGDHSRHLVRFDGIYLRPAMTMGEGLAWVQFFPDGYMLGKIDVSPQRFVAPARFSEIDYSRRIAFGRYSVLMTGATTFQSFGIHERCFHFQYEFGEINPDGRIVMRKQRWLNSDAPSLWGNVPADINAIYIFVPFPDAPAFATGKAFLEHKPVP